MTFKKCLTRQIFYILKDINLKFSRSDLIKSKHENFDMMSSYEEATAESEWGSTVQTDETETWDLGNPKKAWNVLSVLKYVLISCFAGKPVMIITEYMENGSLDTFLKVGQCVTRRGGGDKEGGKAKPPLIRFYQIITEAEKHLISWKEKNKHLCL